MQNTLLNKKRRLNYLYKIVDKKEQTVVFKPNAAQMYLREEKIKLKAKHGRTRLIILKGRQLGITSFELIDKLDDCLFKMNQTLVITAHRQDKQIEMFQKVKFAYEALPTQIEDESIQGGVRYKPIPKYDSKIEYYFPLLNSRIRVNLDSRGGTPSGLHITEIAYRDDAKEMMTGTMPSMPKETPVTIETTAHGMGGYFYNIWERYKHNLEGQEFYTIFLPRYIDDQYASNYPRETPTVLKHLHEHIRIDNGRKLSQEQINRYIEQYDFHQNEVFQEYPTTEEEAFLSSGGNVFNMNIVKNLQKLDYEQDRKFIGLRIFDPHSKYVLRGVDTAEGGADGDFSSILIREHGTLRLLASFYDIYPPDALCEVINYLRGIYNQGIMGIEKNNTGIATLVKARDYPRYNQIYRQRIIDEITQRPTVKLGRATTGKTRPYLISDYETAIRLGYITEVCERTRSEMYSFIYNESKKAEAALGAHDDAIIADAICYQMNKEPIKMHDYTGGQLRETIKYHPVTRQPINIGPKYDIDARRKLITG